MHATKDLDLPRRRSRSTVAAASSLVVSILMVAGIIALFVLSLR